MFVLPLKVSAKVCNEGHACSPPKECCSLGCCYMYSQPTTPVTEMFAILIWTYWYLWAAILAGLTLAAVCGCWLWQRRRMGSSDDSTISDRMSSTSRYAPPHYSRCSSFVQALPPPYNEVTAKPDLYPLVIGYDEGMGKGTSGFVMRYFRTLSHASTLDSLSSSFMCNVVNEANTIIPPPYSCNNSIDELSAMGCDRVEIVAGESVVSLSHNRTTSDISSLAAQSPCSPPRATSPTLELRELLDKIQQLPNEHQNLISSLSNRPQVPHSLNVNSSFPRPSSPSECALTRMRRARGKMYMPLGLPSSRNKTKRWLSRSAPTTPSGNIPMTLLPGQSMRPSETDNYNQQVVPLLSEQEETDTNNIENSRHVSSFSEHEEESQHL
ncbi:uncharacterized protein [Chelonus insularis]|uniref:uncharacterized protein isoform X2 n=1 Tax=Chelonus insularis TaxID=460826 RepID=UPI00158EA7F3|nr:uncharacterized protein LOC118073875 isoform X2 [Chelonus insularis]XP_034950543.1 uncharacterized protein LOC118073875 isoform X2 [Chelonus insularis]XP_034950544.1 uncharacterized protein LOC118073875 isoform X2 [Chelonus insularis]